MLLLRYLRYDKLTFSYRPFHLSSIYHAECKTRRSWYRWGRGWQMIPFLLFIRHCQPQVKPTDGWSQYKMHSIHSHAHTRTQTRTKGRIVRLLPRTSTSCHFHLWYVTEKRGGTRPLQSVQIKAVTTHEKWMSCLCLFNYVQHAWVYPHVILDTY